MNFLFVEALLKLLLWYSIKLPHHISFNILHVLKTLIFFKTRIPVSFPLVEAHEKLLFYYDVNLGHFNSFNNPHILKLYNWALRSSAWLVTMSGCVADFIVTPKLFLLCFYFLFVCLFVVFVLFCFLFLRHSDRKAVRFWFTR